MRKRRELSVRSANKTPAFNALAILGIRVKLVMRLKLMPLKIGAHMLNAKDVQDAVHRFRKMEDVIIFGVVSVNMSGAGTVKAK